MTTSNRLLAVVFAISVAVAGVCLGVWWMVAGHRGLDMAQHGQHQVDASGAAPPAPPVTLDEHVIAALDALIAPYQHIHGLLATDTIVGIGTEATQLSGALGEMLRVVQPRSDDAMRVARALSDAQALAAASSLEGARGHFADISHCLIDLIARAPALRDQLTVFRCPMASGYQKWFQRSATLSNPYLGIAMATCGSVSSWSEAGQTLAPATMSGGSGIAYYTCSMHPFVKQAGPGKCPLCSMDLQPVTKDQVASGEIIVAPQRWQILGVRTAAVTARPMALTIRAAGQIIADESLSRVVSLKVGGWVTDLKADRVGESVSTDDPLFSLYSPEIYAAEQELLLAATPARRAASDASAADEILGAARERLRLWDVSEQEIDGMLRSRTAPHSVTIHAPSSGYVLEKSIVQGSAILPGQALFRIVDLSRVWVLADLYEGDLAMVKTGQKATVAVTYAPELVRAGTIDYIYPLLHGDTRTVKARIVLANAGLALRPGMYATVSLAVDLGTRLQVPKSAVIFTGTRRLVFLDLGGGRLRPRPIAIGLASDDAYEVTAGLTVGDSVVTSGNFLIAAESRIQSAERFWGDDDAAH